MQFSNLSALSLSELKALAISHNAIPTGDKRSKQSWIDVLELVASLAPLASTAAEQTLLELAAEVDINMGLSEEPSDAEMERVAAAVDFAQQLKPVAAHTRSKKSLSSLIVNELASHSPASPRLPLSQPKTSHTSTKKGAATVIGALLVAIIFALTATCSIAHTIVKYTANLVNMFVGGYNPDYDFWYQIQTLAQKRKSPKWVAVNA